MRSLRRRLYQHMCYHAGPAAGNSCTQPPAPGRGSAPAVGRHEGGRKAKLAHRMHGEHSQRAAIPDLFIEFKLKSHHLSCHDSFSN